MPSHRTVDERTEITRIVLESPIEMSHQKIADKVGLQRETVRQIRYGIINADVAVELPRFAPNALNRRCSQCRFFLPENHRKREGANHIPLPVCDLGIDESRLLTYARGCGAFWPMEGTHPDLDDDGF